MDFDLAVAGTVKMLHRAGTHTFEQQYLDVLAGKRGLHASALAGEEPLLCQSRRRFAALHHWTRMAAGWHAGVTPWSPACPTCVSPNCHDCLPDLRLLTDPADLEHYGRDWTRRWTPAPLAIALPASVDEVLAVVRWANDYAVALVPSGGRTGLSGGAVAANGELVLSLERMNRVLDFNAVDRTLTVEPGIILQRVHEAARAQGLIYPVDFAARGSCSIGGNIATNAGGIRVIRYGNTREWIAALKVVTGSGELLELNRGLIKNSSGYDFRQLMIGSEGTLGIVVEATLKLTDPPPPSQVMLLALPDMDALMQVFALFRAAAGAAGIRVFHRPRVAARAGPWRAACDRWRLSVLRGHRIRRR